MARRALLLSFLCSSLALPALAGTDIHCQVPFWTGVNASTGLNSEIADDVPVDFAGETVTQLTLWVAEWLAGWQDPDGIILNIYDGTCGPPASPVVQHVIPWGSLTATFDQAAGSMISYKVVIDLPVPLTIGLATTIGVSVDTPWGASPPYAGFLAANYNAPEGCGEFYLDSPTVGAPRWTAGSAVHSFSADLSYCLTTGGATPVPEPGISSWAHVKARYR